MKVDIIIPTKQINRFIYESIPEILKLDYLDYGLILLPDAFNGESFPRTRIVPTGNIGPAQKRDLALEYSQADILAFLDDDAYPKRDWLKKALPHFSDPDVAAVGGPAVTPSSDSFKQKVSGAVFLTKLGGGFPERYWPIGKVRTIEDWPSVNLMVRKDIFKAVGGFNSAYWPGEDTKLCLDILKMGKKIIYDPAVLVYHHRREGFWRHLRQVGRYGLHRGFFARRFPETSRKWKYFIPSAFTLFIATGAFLPLVNQTIMTNLYLTGIAFYLLSLVVALYEIWNKERQLGLAAASLPFIFSTHIWYGLRFMQGFFLTRDLKSKLRTQGQPG